MLLHPGRNTLAKTKVMKMPLKISNRTLDHRSAVDDPLPSDILGPIKPHHPNRVNPAVPNPTPHKVILVPQPISRVGKTSIVCYLQQLLLQVLRDDFVGVGEIDPRMLVLDLCSSPIQLGGLIFEGLMKHPATSILRDLNGSIVATRV
jgi:hypothetical protein